MCIAGSKTNYLSSLAYQAKTWKFGDKSSKFFGSDLDCILANMPSHKVLRTINGRLTISAKEIVHIMDSQSVAKAVSTFRRLVPKPFPSMCVLLPCI